MFIQLLKLESDEVVTTLKTGVHELGRGEILQCNDKRVSRNHATIEINQDRIIFTSTHINPCFIRSADSKTIRILKKDKSEELNDGDAFALLPEDFWFKIRKIENNNSEFQNIVRKLSSDNETDIPPIKKIKVEESKKIYQEGETPEKQEPTTSSKEEISQNKVEENEADKSADFKPKREKCWYAHNCYRKNVLHRDEFSHPGDSDFETDSQDNRPTCSYGAKCYRKSKEHMQNFKHPPRQSSSKKKRNRQKVNLSNAATTQELNEFLGPESEDPFVDDDDDSDEYEEESEDYESDWPENETDE